MVTLVVVRLRRRLRTGLTVLRSGVSISWLRLFTFPSTLGTGGGYQLPKSYGVVLLFILASQVSL